MTSLLLVLTLFITCSKDDNTVVQYSLSVEVNPVEGGSVSPSSGKYDDGETITLLATPSLEYVFKNWSGGASGTSNPTTTIMNSNKAVTAVFEKRQYPLTIEIEGEGTVTEELLSSKPASNFPSGSSVLLTAVPANGWEFVEWSGDHTGVDNPVTISIDKPKNIKVKFQPILYNQILGKWDVNNLSIKPSYNKSSSKKDDIILAKITDGVCIVYSLVFNSDGSFVLSLSSGEINGAFYFDSANSIVLNDTGKVDNIHITNNVLNFHLNLNNLCSSDETAEDDEDYVEGECVSFLDCNDGNVWLLQTAEGQKFMRMTNDLENIWIEHYTFDEGRHCMSQSMTNQTSDYSVILLENNIEQMTYVLANTLEGDVSAIMSITADNNLSVMYDYVNDALDETDYYSLVSADSLNEYLNSYSECYLQGLIAYYPFNSNANDESGNNNNGIVSDAQLTTDRFGNLNSAFKFNGVSSYIEATISNIPLNNSSRTISGWFKTDYPNAKFSNESTQICIINYGSLISKQRLSLCIYLKGYLETTNGPSFTNENDFYVNNYNYLDNNWYFFTLVYDGNIISLYVNGVYAGGKSINLETSNSPLRIGRRISGDNLNEFFKGTIDDIGIWNRALTEQEILAIFNSTF